MKNELEAKEQNLDFSGGKGSCRNLRTDLVKKNLLFKLFEATQGEKQI